MSLFKRKSKTYFDCKVCGKPQSKTGNYTNMILCKMYDADKFNNKYGILCADHAGELTKRLVVEKDISQKDLEMTIEVAERMVAKELGIDPEDVSAYI